MTNSTFSDFLYTLRFRESTDNYQNDLNPYGYMGAYQLGEAALAQTGYYLAGETGLKDAPGSDKEKNTWDGSWTGKDGVNILQDYLNSEIAQDNAVTELMSYNWDLIRGEGLDAYIGREVKNVVVDIEGAQEDVPITDSGMILAAHLRGVSHLRDFLRSNGEVNPLDELGTPIAEYTKLGEGYDLPLESFPPSVAADTWLPGTSLESNGWDVPCKIAYGQNDQVIYETSYATWNSDINKFLDTSPVRDLNNPVTCSEEELSWQKDGAIRALSVDGSSYAYFACDNTGYYQDPDPCRLVKAALSGIEVLNGAVVTDAPTISPTYNSSYIGGSGNNNGGSDIATIAGGIAGGVAGLLVLKKLITGKAFGCATDAKSHEEVSTRDIDVEAIGADTSEAGQSQDDLSRRAPSPTPDPKERAVQLSETQAQAAI